jgi:hypothetical protein
LFFLFLKSLSYNYFLGHINNALVDLTGGVPSRINLKKDVTDKEKFWKDLLFKSSSGEYLLGVDAREQG